MNAKIAANRKKAFVEKAFLVSELVRIMDEESRRELWPRMNAAVTRGNYYECTGILAEYGLEPDYLNIWL